MRRLTTFYLNAHCRTDSPFSWDSTLVLLPSLTSHKMTVPSTDADAKTAPLEEKFIFLIAVDDQRKSGEALSSYLNSSL